MQNEPQIVLDLLELSRMQDSDDIFHMTDEYTPDLRETTVPNWGTDVVGQRYLFDEFQNAPEEPNEEPAPLWFDI
jgi:hypothetical protein